MLFNSYEYIFLFLPVVFTIYFALNRLQSNRAALAWLVVASLFFYSWWNPIYLPLILISITVNYLVGSSLANNRHITWFNRRWLLIIGIFFNLALLGYYKYADFLISNVNAISSSHISLLKLVLPLGISFFTFTQIAYLADAYRGEAREYRFVNYALFVTFFPHLLAGPILHHREMMPQFEDETKRRPNYENMARGLFLFSLGLFKKVVIADAFAVWANTGFDQVTSLSLLEAWITSLSYTFQLYFDFSAYTDMAIASALFFNIVLPINFNSPYKSLSIQEFWRRWHMTLGRFFRDYIYIPLGGNRRGQARTYGNLLVTFGLVGLWHGAGWTFVFWGFLHGVALVINRWWRTFNIKMPKVLAWLITFNFVNLAWVFFRARSWTDALKVVRGMLGLSGVVLPAKLQPWLDAWHIQGLQFGQAAMGFNIKTLSLALCSAFVLCLLFKNSIDMKNNLKPTWYTSVLAAVLIVSAILGLTRVSEFIYFNF